MNKLELIRVLKDFHKSEMSHKRKRQNNEKVTKYGIMFKRVKPSISTQTFEPSWDNVERCAEMSALINEFSHFDPINDLSTHQTAYNNQEVDDDIIEFSQPQRPCIRGSIIMSYLCNERFNKTLLKSRMWDCIVNAIVTYLLSSSLDTLLWLKDNCPQYATFVAAIYDEKISSSPTLFVMNVSSYSWIYTRTPFKLLNRQFNNACLVEKPTFHILHNIEAGFVDELTEFYDKLKANTIDEQMVKFLEQDKPIPHDLQHIVGNYANIVGKSNVRYFTGQACCGKTTLVSKLNFEAKSRGSIGGFSGKADNIASVSCLHFSIDFVLRQYKTIVGVSIYNFLFYTRH